MFFYITLEHLLIDINGYLLEKIGSTRTTKEVDKYHPRMYIDCNVNYDFYNHCYTEILNTVGKNNIAFITTISDKPHHDKFHIADKVDWVREHFGFDHDLFFCKPLEKHLLRTRDCEILIDVNATECSLWNFSPAHDIIGYNSHLWAGSSNFNKWFTEFKCQIEDPL